MNKDNEIGMSGYSKFAWKLWKEAQLPMAKCEIVEQIIKELGYRKQNNEGSECPTCHGTGYIGTTDWLTKGMAAEELAKEKAEAIAEHEQQIKTDYARVIFEDIEKLKYTKFDWSDAVDWDDIAELRNKYIGGK